MYICVCVLDKVWMGRGMTVTLENSMTTPQMKSRRSVTHLTAKGLRESLFQLWFSIQSQKKISVTSGVWTGWGFGADTERWRVRGKRGDVSASGLWTNNPDEQKEHRLSHFIHGLILRFLSTQIQMPWTLSMKRVHNKLNLFSRNSQCV